MNLRQQRRYLGVSQKELARRMGTTGNTVARWERGEVRMPGPAKKLIELLVQIRQLMNEQEQGNE